MSVNITETHEGGGGHTRFDFEINPKDSGQQSKIFRQGMEIEEAITRNHALDKFDHLSS